MNAASSIVTVNGRVVDPFNLTVEDIHWPDIAHALSYQNRWSGHTLRRWSVAQHSIVVASIVGPSLELWALLHDATEAYLVDVPRPLKRSPAFGGYLEAETRALAVILAAAGVVAGPMPAEVREADDAVLVAEARAFFPAGAFKWGGLPAVRESLVAEASEWIEADQALEPGYVAQRWLCLVTNRLVARRVVTREGQL